MRTLIAALLICGTALPVMAQDMSGATEASRRFTGALSAGDAATAASFFADSGVALPPGRGQLDGKAQIQQFLGNMTRAVKDLKYVPDDVKPIDDATAREIGTFSFKPQKQGGQDVTGKYLIIWTKVGDDWKISADMWNRSAMGGGRQGAGRNGRKSGGTKTGGTEAQ